MEADARYTYVGAAVLVLLGALVAALIWLQGVGGRGEFNRFAIHFEGQALDGLEVGAEVNLRGIRVGRVEDYGLSGDRINRVRVVVRVDRRAPVRTSTVAVVARNFVTGIAKIALVNRGPEGEPLTKVPEGESLPVIREGQSNIDEITGRVNHVGELTTQALSNVNQWLQAENREEFMNTVRSVRELASGANSRLGSFDQTLGRAADAIGQIGVAAGRLGQAGDRLASVGERMALVSERMAVVGEQTGARLDSTLDRTGRSMEQALARAEQTLEEARTTLAQVSRSAQGLERLGDSAKGQLEASALVMEDQLAAAVGELRASVEAATRVFDALRDPRAALLGPGRGQLGPGEARP